MITKRQQQTEEFVRILPQLEAVEFLGVAKLLGVELFETPKVSDKETPENTLIAPVLGLSEGDEKKQTPREAGLVIDETISRFAAISKQKQRELLKVLRPLVKKRGDRNGTTTNH